MPTRFQLIANVVASSIIASVAILGNLMIIIIFVRFKELRNVNNAAITVLSLNDFFRGSIVMVAKIYNQVRFSAYVTRPDLDEPICTLTAMISAFTFVFSPMVLALIALIRYLLIVPWNIGYIEFTKTKFIIAISILCAIASVIASLPIMGVGRYRYSQSHGVCFTDWCDDQKTFRTIFYIVVIGVALPIVLICYTMLLLALRKHKKGFVTLTQLPRAIVLERSENSTSRRNKTYDENGDSGKTKSDKTQQYLDALLDDSQNCPDHFPRLSSLTSQGSIVDDPIYEHMSKQENRVTKVTLMIYYCRK